MGDVGRRALDGTRRRHPTSDIRHPTTSDDVEACDDGLGVGSRTHRARRRAPPTDDDDQRRTSDHKGRIHRDISRSRIAVAVVRDVANARDDSGGRTRARGRRGVWV